ncbi:hypothetical protein ACFLUH_01175 [Chloroflexota bacterium]
MESNFTNATNIPTTPTGVAIDITGQYLFVAGHEYFSVFDISSPTSPSFSNKITTSPGSVQDFSRIVLTSDGDYAYVTKYQNNSVIIVDVSDPTCVSQAGTLTDSTYLYGVREIQVVDDALLYGFNFSGDTFYLSVWDISTDPTDPTRRDSFDLSNLSWSPSGRIGGFVIDDYDTAYVGRYYTTTSKGFASIDLTP